MKPTRHLLTVLLTLPFFSNPAAADVKERRLLPDERRTRVATAQNPGGCRPSVCAMHQEGDEPCPRESARTDFGDDTQGFHAGDFDRRCPDKPDHC